ncbi:MAG: DUF2125 domain-containing protein, partial [Paracoccaceae bacterium]|nr:DUF2125 domain-containing protein [Paracoccaceae bacterium]
WFAILVIVAAIAWSGYWFWSASVQKAAIEGWFDNRRSGGWVADFSDLTVKGFPNRLDTTLTAPRLGDPDVGVIWETPFLQLFRLSYNAKHLIAVLANEQTIKTSTREIGVTTSDLRASLEIEDLNTVTPERFILVAEDFKLETTDDRTLGIDVAQISAEATAHPNTYRLALDARGLKGALPGWIESDTNNAIDRITVDLEVQLSGPINLAHTTQLQPESITIHLAEAQWNGLSIAAAGDVEIGTAGTPVGRVTLKLRNWRELIAAERQTGRLSQRALNQIDITLSLISGLSGNPETLDLPFDFVNGKIWLGPLMIGDAPRLQLP